ncbi:NnrS family protein [Polycladidibacter hongkongensis]|uniref:NnrS family protein n=1 Tax=Polycladidibacter hongkongensis TaxID=1647556 RepID=UPI000836926A|nr:NnrS family protein [Pseudovibrio hongkongensis]
MADMHTMTPRVWYTGFFQAGFKCFFFSAAVWAVLAMLLWIPLVSGHISLPLAMDAVSWHAHAFLFGYLYAVLAGFLLTAMPNWTGRPALHGLPLAGLFALWLCGRLGFLLSQYISLWQLAALELSMPLALLAFCLHEVIKARNWRNLVVAGLIALLLLADAMYLANLFADEYAAQGVGQRLGIAAMLLMVGLIGGRIIPAFTRNWLTKRGAGKLPTAPMQGYDKLSLLVLLLSLILWVADGSQSLVAVGLLLSSVLHLGRLSRWCGLQTLAEPLLFVLHVSYCFLPLGLAAMGVSLLLPDLIDAVAAQHLAMSGVMGMITLAVMSRATLGHSGGALVASKGTVALYLSMFASVTLRFVAGYFPEHALRFYEISAVFWLAAFFGFLLVYGGRLLKSSGSS